MIRIEARQHFPVSLRDGFDYITTVSNWPEYWPRLVRVEPGSRWRAPGDQARLVLRLLGRPVGLEMTLCRLEPYRLVEYTSVQRGLPDARHERHFADAEGGFDYRLVVELERRSGWRGLYDRALVRRATERAMWETLANLRTVLGARERASCL
jgi:Polyketide cyclase / dehydrase and lipid transport